MHLIHIKYVSVCLLLNGNTDLRAFQVVFRHKVVFQTPGGRYAQNILQSQQHFNDGILADLRYLWLISFALRLDHLIRQLVFVSVEMTKLPLARYETVQQPCEQSSCAVPGGKKKV